MKKQIKVLIMDVDGTLTDGKIYMGAAGELFKAFHVKDGCGIKDILPKYGIIPVVITARESKITKNRCQELNIEYLYQGVKNKLEKMEEVLSVLSEEHGENYTHKNVAYIGDDITDIECMEKVSRTGGIVGCPADAASQVYKWSQYQCSLKGGEGAVREFIEWMIRA